MKLAAPETASTQLWNHECWLLSSAAEGWAVENVSQVNLSTDEMELVWCVSLKQPLVLQGVWFYISLQFSHSLWVCVQALFRPSQPPQKSRGWLFPISSALPPAFLLPMSRYKGTPRASALFSSFILYPGPCLSHLMMGCCVYPRLIHLDMSQSMATILWFSHSFL